MMAALVVGGVVLLLGGGELLVRGAVGLARGYGVSPLVIGLTVVAFGTSAPELVVSLEAALGGHTDIVLGNVVGSNIANILVVVGVAALLRPIVMGSGVVRRDGAILVAATLVFIGVCYLGSIERGLGAAMVAALAAYTVWSFWAARREAAPAIAELGDEIEEAPRRPWLALAFTAAGIAGVVVGADLLIDGAVQVARLAGLSEAVIGLSLIAFGTSLPELATATMAALRGHSDLAVGNALGSNLFNMFAIAGVTAVVVPVPVPGELVVFDLWVMLGVTVALLAMMASGRRVTRIEGAVLVVAYALYIALIVGGAAPGKA
jgi:cation:H+ antiporter